MKSYLKLFGAAGFGLFACFANTNAALSATEPKPIEIKGEIIDTWCYLSGVMGGQDAVIGTAHHTCALWCAAGGIPVGVLDEDGQIYMVLKLKGEDTLKQSDSIMEIQSDVITAKGPSLFSMAEDFSAGSNAKEFGLEEEVKSTFSAKVVDMVCEIAGDCTDNCGNGERQLGLLIREAGSDKWNKANRWTKEMGRTQSMKPKAKALGSDETLVCKKQGRGNGLFWFG
ncbi:hypothetical protein GQR58_004291 [Nymphon striatum]|nr:hypothetical protein GQR58_004291 [Nymphon striatum]